MSPGTRIQLWRVGDRVRFAHQHPSGPVYEVTKTLIDMNQPMVELKDMVGQFGGFAFDPVSRRGDEGRDGVPGEQSAWWGQASQFVDGDTR